PSNPQSWNRYGYVNGMPLSLIDPLGKSPIGICPVAERGDVGPRATVNAISGPYDATEAGDVDAGEGNDGSCVKISSDPFAVLTVDGVTLDSGLASELELGGPGGTGAALDLNASSSCRTIDCTPTIPGHDGNPQQMGGQWIPPYCAEVGKDGTCLQSKGAYWQWGAETSPALVLASSGTSVGPTGAGDKPAVPAVEAYCASYRDGTCAGEILDGICKHFPVPPGPHWQFWSECVRG